MLIRDEQAADLPVLDTLITTAFETNPYSCQNEAQIVTALRADGQLTLSLVAEDQGQVVGHIAFSPIGIEGQNPGQDLGWYSLGPLAVIPERQRQGIGRALVTAGLERLQALGAAGVFLVGDQGYYGQFGFRSHYQLFFDGIPTDVCLSLAFGGEVPAGTVQLHPAFLAALGEE